MKKRLIALLLACLFLFVGTAFAEEAEAPVAETVEEVAAPAGNANDGVIHMTADSVLVDHEGYSVTFTGDSNVSGDYLYLNVVVVNGTDRNVGIRFVDVSINGWEVFAGAPNSVLPGKKAKDKVSFQISDADVTEMAQIEDIEMKIRLYDGDSDDEIWTSEVVHLQP